MASINGITVKALKQFRGHEGEPLYQGNVYLGNKKIGWWTQDSHGGSDYCYLDAPYSIRKLENKLKELNRDKEETFSRDDGSTYTIDYSLDVMFGDLMALKSDEDTFKSAVKNGFAGILLVTDGYHVFGWNLNKEIANLPDEVILTRFAGAIEEGKKKHNFFKEDKFTKHETKIYCSFNDFNVGKTIKLSDIK
jgi:hypothetical protein